jgi:hypothetical protein
MLWAESNFSQIQKKIIISLFSVISNVLNLKHILIQKADGFGIWSIIAYKKLKGTIIIYHKESFGKT